MKKTIILFLSLLNICAKTFAYDFYAISPSGHTLYYNIQTVGNNVSITYPNSDPYNPYTGFEEPLGSLIIPDSVHINGNDYCVTSIGDWSFAFCSNITSVSIPNTVKTIGDCAFGECVSLSKLSMPDSIVSIGVCAFQGCAIDTIVLPQSVTTIGNFAFKNCIGLVSLSIPTSVVNVGFMAFDSCISLTSVSVDNNTLLLSVNDTNMGNVHIEVPQTSSWDYSLKIFATPKQDYRYIRWSNLSTSNPDLVYLSSDSVITAVLTYAIEPRICMVNVEDERNVLYIDRDENAIQYNIYREGEASNDYVLLASIDADSSSSWQDSNSRPNTRSYRYRVSGVDRFGYESDLSSVHKTMHLTISQGIGNQWNLSWTPYVGVDYTTYIIYRGTSASGLEQIDIIPSNGNTSYTDDDAPSGDVFYQVGIVMEYPCQSNPSISTSKSETICKSNIATNGNISISDIKTDDLQILYRNGKITVEGILQEQFNVFDMIGRKMENNSLPAGVYLVKVGNRMAKKVVAIK